MESSSSSSSSSTSSSSSSSTPKRTIVGQINSLVVPRFSGDTTFARLPRSIDVPQYDVAVIGAPFDAGCSYRPGARFGPRSVRAGSSLLRPYNPSLLTRPFDEIQVVDAGDAPLNPFNIEEALSQMQSYAWEILTSSRHNRIITIGGDHTISLPLLRTVHRHYGPVSLLHFDAHLDTWDTYFGQPYTHGTPFRRAWEEGLLKKDGSMHVGTRGPIYSENDMNEDESFGFRVIRADEIEIDRIGGVVKRIVDRVGDSNVYLSIDIDVLDPAFAPGTGTPEPGGFTSRELLAILRGLANAGVNVISADVMEVSPAYDHAELTSQVAASLCYEILCWYAMLHRKSEKSK